MDIKQLIKNWYYSKKLLESSRQMFISNQIDIWDYSKAKKETEEVEDKLFSILKNEYGVKYPYTDIPVDLDYVLKIVS